MKKEIERDMEDYKVSEDLQSLMDKIYKLTSSPKDMLNTDKDEL